MRLETTDPIKALQLSLQAYKSLVSDYALRTRQAEDMTSMLLNKLPDAQADILVNRIQSHMSARELERSTQYLGVLQTTLLILTGLQQTFSAAIPEQLNSELLEVIKALTVTVNQGGNYV